MVRVRIKPGTANSFQSGQIRLKLGQYQDVPASAIPNDETAKAVLEIIDNDFRFVQDRRTLRIFFPRPGIGDIHWIFLKLRSLLKRCGADQIDALMATEDGRPPKRSEYFVGANPLVGSVKYIKAPARSLPYPGYLIGGESDPWDYALDATHFFDDGRSIETEFLPEVDVDWHYLQGYEMFAAPVRDDERKDAVCLSMLNGQHHGWGEWWSAERWRDFANLVARRTQVIAVGLQCDRAYATSIQEMGGTFQNRAGETDHLADLIALLRRCRGVVGTCSGLTMIAAAAGIPTVIIWPKKFWPQSARNWIHPSAYTYYPTSWEMGPKEVYEIARRAFGLDTRQLAPRTLNPPLTLATPGEIRELKRLGKNAHLKVADLCEMAGVDDLKTLAADQVAGLKRLMRPAKRKGKANQLTGPGPGKVHKGHNRHPLAEATTKEEFQAALKPERQTNDAQ